jgi:hypothetical protein
MARSMKTKTTTKVDTETQPIIEDSVAEEVEEKEVIEAKPQKKVFAKDDLIRCHSIAVGQTFMDGKKTGNTYVFEAMGAESEVEYQDLIAAVNINSKYLFKPLIVVDDKDFINQSPKLKKFYDGMYSVEDLTQIFRLSPARIKEELDILPEGAKDSLKSLASEYIAKGKLDSVKVIKTLDEYFGTQLMLLTGLYDD